jgi:molecular chaperone HtpG
MASSSETFAFQAEINQLMSLIINTFYSNKDIFLRELISNSSDALDKIRHESLSDKSKIEAEPNFEIKITPNKEEKTFTIEDTGIGMTKDDLINCLGTIAKSGTKQFMESLKNSDQKLIGQFGVGFYSAYLVADTVEVFTKHNNSDCTLLWKSNAGGTFEISTTDVQLSRGTRMVLHMKEDQLEYCDEAKIENLIKIHSEFISYPIKLLKITKETKEVPVEEDTADEIENTHEVKVEDADESKSKTKTITEEKSEYVQVNKQKPIWTRKPEEISDEEYKTFYKNLTNDWEDCLKYNHFSVEGQLEFKGLLYVPKRAPFDMFESTKKKQNNIKLYVKRIFITDDCKDIVPEYLSFVKGIVDSEDLPLNISREMFQQNKIMKVIKKNVTKKCIEMLKEISESSDFKTFYESFSKNIKLGIHEDSANRAKLAELLRYNTNSKEFMSLDSYIEDMKENQQSIYYICGESTQSVKNNPSVKAVQKLGYQVIYMTDPLDEYIMQQLKDYKDKKFVCVTKEGLDIAKVDDATKEKYKVLCEKVKTELGDNVEKVQISISLGDSPCAILTSEYGWSANMERIMKAQALNNSMNMGYMSARKTLELNVEHKIIKELCSRVENEKEIKDIVSMMYDVALLSGGFGVNDTNNFCNKCYNMITAGLGIEEDDPETLHIEEGNIVDSQIKEEESLEAVD